MSDLEERIELLEAELYAKTEEIEELRVAAWQLAQTIATLTSVLSEYANPDNWAISLNWPPDTNPSLETGPFIWFNNEIDPKLFAQQALGITDEEKEFPDGSRE